MNKKNYTKQLCLAGVFGALYVVLTLPLGALAYSPFVQVRPAEALTLLPMLFPFAGAFGVTIGCMIVNLIGSSPLDMLLGGAITLIACLLTSKIKNPFFAALPPVLLNAICLPLMFLLMGSQISYWYTFLSILISQSLWIYGLGLPLYFFLKKKDISKLY